MISVGRDETSRDEQKCESEVCVRMMDGKGKGKEDSMRGIRFFSLLYSFCTRDFGIGIGIGVGIERG